jgi:hypothetical protein
MAVPTLTPASTTSAITLPTGSSPGDVASAALPFGIYSNVSDNPTSFSRFFCTGASDQVAYVYKKLGGDILDIELTKEQVFSAYEEATLEYSYIMNIHQAKNILGSALGNTTGTFDHDGTLQAGTLSSSLGGAHVSLTYPKWQFSYGKRIADGISLEGGLGGDTRVYSASIDISDENKQDFDLQQIISSAAASNSSVDFYDKVGNKRIHITRVWYKTPQAMWRFYGYYGGLNTVGDLASYGQFADDSTFEIIPAWQNKLQAMAFEDAIYTRNSHWSYEIKNNRLRIFPKPTRVLPDSMWIEFFVRNDIWEEDDAKQDGTEGINNMSTLPFDNLPYNNINAIGKQWIRRFALAVCKEMLGYIRSKFSSIPIPGDSISLNGGDLISQAKTEQQVLRDELKTTLEELTYAKIAEREAMAIDSVTKVQEKMPYPVPIVLG